MNRRIELHSNVTKELLIKNAFKELPGNRFSIYTVLYKPLIILRLEINLDEREVVYDVFDRNTQAVYYPFWNNTNGENNLVAVEVIRNFDKYISELQDRKILKKCRREKKSGKRNKEN